jgi:hypothetical protein
MDEVIHLASDEEGSQDERGSAPSRNGLSRPSRRAALAAQERILQGGKRNPDERGSDEELSEDGEEAATGDEEVEGGSNAGDKVDSVPMSAYELGRLQNIEQNNAVLESLGLLNSNASALAGGQAAATPAPKRSRPASSAAKHARSARLAPHAQLSGGSSGRSAKRATEDISSSASLSDSDSEAAETGKSRAAPSRSEQKRPLGSSPASSSAAAAEAVARDLFELLAGGSGAGKMITLGDLLRVSREMRLGFPTDDLPDMIQLFDGSAKGGLDFREFVGVVQMAAEAPAKSKSAKA